MKTLLFRLLFFSATILFITSCDKDDPFKEPTSVKITRITLLDYPLTSGGTPWDDPFIGSATPPDISWQITGPNTIASTVYFPDADGDTLYFSSGGLPNYLNSPKSVYTLMLWDEDDLDGSDLASDDDVMVSISFTPWQAKGDEERDAIVLQAADTEIYLDVTYLYE